MNLNRTLRLHKFDCALTYVIRESLFSIVEGNFTNVEGNVKSHIMFNLRLKIGLFVEILNSLSIVIEN